MKYLIIDTWNGEGYSESGIIGEAYNKLDAMDMAINEFKERYAWIDSYVYFNLKENAIFYDNGKDQGAIHVLPCTENDRAVVINPSINEVSIYDSMDYCIEYYMSDAENKWDCLEELKTEGRTLAETNDGDVIIIDLKF